MEKLTQAEAEGIAQFWADLPVEIMDGDDKGYAQECWEAAREMFTQEMDAYLIASGFPDCYTLFNQDGLLQRAETAAFRLILMSRNP